jgi:iron complex outermembrane recepter protein
MNRAISFGASRALKAAVSIALYGAATMYASVAVAEDEKGLEEVVVTGTRKAGQLATDTMSPVDVISGAAIAEQPAFNLTDALTRISPSLNTQRFPIADGTALIRPVSLRSLSPDHTLVLMNGVRRHRSALVNLQLPPLGTVNQGAQAVDWAAFPAYAIERVEVLRDGAGAQYGSDAVAGVINVILKDSNQGVSAQAQYGSYYEGDGDRFTASGNLGLPLTDNGFVNMTAEYSSSDITWRGVARPDAAAINQLSGNSQGQVPLHGLGQRWGDPSTDVWKFLVNSSVDISESTEIYGFATYMNNTTESDFFYRRPVLSDPVAQQGLSARTTLQIDNNGDGLPDPAPQSLVDSITGQGLNPSDYLTPWASPSGYALRNPIYTNFPGGYNPSFGADMTDLSIVGGVRGDATPTLSWDLAARYGENEIDYTLNGSINPSLGGLSPFKFHPGKLTQEETGVNLDFVKTFEGSPLNIGFGAEWRDETYKIAKGDNASIEAGPTAAVFGVGSDGFQGFPKESAGDWDSNSWALYVDAETDLTDKLSGGVAFRYEDYQEWGNTFDWKVSVRYDFTDSFALRATANTGFRSPTPGQVHTLNVTTTSNSAGDLIPNGTFPVDNPIAVALGAKPLDPEQSTSYTAGLVWDVSASTSFTLDWYHIHISDRLALVNIHIGAPEVADLIAAGIPNAALLFDSNAGYFVNGFDSSVNGIDVALTSRFDVGPGSLLADLRYNWNDPSISSVKTGTIDSNRVYDLENQIPNDRAVLTLDYTQGGAFETLMRLNYYGSWSTSAGLFYDPSNPTGPYSYGSNVLVDLEASYKFAEKYTVALGAENVFDQHPDKEKDGTLQFLGVKDALTSPFGFNGGLWYLRLAAKF